MKFTAAEKYTLSLYIRRGFRFVLWFLAIFLVSFTALSFLGFVPRELQFASEQDTSISAPIAEEVKGEVPVRIIIPRISVNSSIYNPQSNDVDVLDAELTKGVVRYPGSGIAGKGNMFLFGHASGLRVVNNPAFKVFTNLKTLESGDLIHVYSKEKKYTYKVAKVTLVDADKALVDFSTKRNMLTISTCNTFGEKQERYVVEADLVSTSGL